MSVLGGYDRDLAKSWNFAPGTGVGRKNWVISKNTYVKGKLLEPIYFRYQNFTFDFGNVKFLIRKWLFAY